MTPSPRRADPRATHDGNGGEQPPATPTRAMTAQRDLGSPSSKRSLSTDPDGGHQLTVDELLASARADALAARVHAVEHAREQVRVRRAALSDAARDFEAALRDAHRRGASVRQLAAASGLGKSHVHMIVRRAREEQP